MNTSRGTSVIWRWAADWMIEGSSPGGGWDYFYSPPRPDRFWCPPGFLSCGYRGPFPWGWSGRGVELSTRFRLVLRSKNAWCYASTIPILLHGVVLGWKSTGTTYLYLLLYMKTFVWNGFLLNRFEDLPCIYLSWTVLTSVGSWRWCH
jgi:hypothetical protein